jgi:hypothetical protein
MFMNSRIGAVSRVLSLCGFALATTCGSARIDDVQPQPERAAQVPLVRTALRTTGGEIQEVSVVATDREQWVSVSIGGAMVDMLVEPFSVRAPTFEVWLRGEQGDLTRYDAPAPKTVRGAVVGEPFSKVWGAVDGGSVNLTIERLGHETVQVRSVAGLLPHLPAELHLVHTVVEVMPAPGTCGVDDAAMGRALPAAGRIEPAAGVHDEHDEHDADDEAPVGDALGGDELALGLFVTQVSFDSDNEFFVAQGSNANNCIDYIDQMMVGVDAVYRAQVGISYSLNRIVLSPSASDPFGSGTSASSRLVDLRNVWENSPFNGFERDVVQGIMGIDFDGNTIGVAYICNNGGCSGQICTRRNNFTCPFGDGTGADCGGYSVVEDINTAGAIDQLGLSAHELGHNWGAQHCNGEGDCFIMCTNIGGCMGSALNFGVSSRNSIISHRNSRPCLHTSATTVYVRSTHTGAELGTVANPYITFRAGAFGCETGGIMQVTPANYDGGHSLLYLARPMTIFGNGATSANPVRITR